MKVIRKKPGEAPEICEVENTLEALQKEVGGYIQAVQFSTDCAIICNEEGKLIRLRPNLAFCGDVLFGTILVVGVDGEEFCSLDQTVAETLLNWMGVRKTWRS